MLSQSQERNAFLSELSAAEFSIMRSYLVLRELRVGDRLHNLGDGVEEVVFPHSGLVAMTMPLRDGPGAAVVLVGREGVVGGLAAAAAAPATCNAEVRITGYASRMSAASYRHVLDQNAAIRQRIARFDSAMLAQAQRTAFCHATHSVEARTCRWLLEIEDRIGSSKVPLTQGTLAQMLGVRRTTITLVAGRLEAAGILTYRRGYADVLSREGLERRTCDCYAHAKSYMAALFASGLGESIAAGVTASAPKAVAREQTRRRAV
jgi:CRP-like cAMP-binding protein